MIQMDMGKTVKTADVEKAIEEYKLDPEIIYSGEGNKADRDPYHQVP